MSYIITIRRPGGPSISAEELRSLIREEEDLKAGEDDSADDSYPFFWTGEASGEPFGLCLTAGEVDSTTTPSEAALARMQVLADRLGARVFGEAGEELTTGDVPADKVSSCATSGCVPLVLGPLIARAWWFS